MKLNRRNIMLGILSAGVNLSLPQMASANMSRSEVQIRNKVLSNANKLVGLYEKDPKDRKYLINYFYRNLGTKVDPVKTPWCAAYVDAVLAESGFPTLDTLWARNFLDYGFPVDVPKKGDIAVFTRGKGFGHVGFFLDFQKANGVEYVTLLNGNIAGKVAISNYPQSKLLGFRSFV